MLEEIDTLWRTAPLRAEKPTPSTRCAPSWRSSTRPSTPLSRTYRRVDDALQGPGAGSRAPVVRPFVRLGTWVGGDRDGNPFVTASVTKKAAGIAAEHILLGLANSPGASPRR
jgi:phosphoenolpyruvate carboxylase